MTTAIKRRRGTTTQHSTFTGLEGELTVDTTKKTVVVHDGSTAGGFPLAKESQATSSVAITGGSINGTTVGASTASTGRFTTLEATGVTTVQAGTVSAPAITTSGDTNTGIFFPAADTIAFTEGGVESMRIDSAGNVGIGTSSPLEKLDVLGIFVASDANRQFVRLRMDSGVARVESTFASGASGAYRPLAFSTSDTERMRITSGGEVYIAGTTDQGAYNLQVNGTGVWGAGAYVNGSDERIKENISPIESGLDVVEKLNPVTYRYKEEWSKDQSTQTGFIAQELLTALDGQIYVDGVVQQGGEYMSVAYQNIIPILTKAIQELNAKVVELEAKLNSK